MRRKITIKIGPVDGVAFTKREAQAMAEQRAAQACWRLSFGTRTFARPPGSNLLAFAVHPTLEQRWAFSFVYTPQDLEGVFENDYTARLVGVGFPSYDLALYTAVEEIIRSHIPPGPPALAVQVQQWVGAVLGDYSQSMVLQQMLSGVWTKQRKGQRDAQPDV